MSLEPNKQGLVLEGGGTRGVFTSGVLDFLMEQDCYFPYVVGVSAGACNAVDYVSKQIGRTRDCMIHKDNQDSYFNLRNAVKNHSLFDMDMIFDRYPNELYPFDYETFFQSKIRCEVVATNCMTGRAVYLSEKKDKQRLMTICRASSSLPLASTMVKLEGGLFLDGGIADSIPILRSLKCGNAKNVVVLTRNYGYRKTPLKRSKKLYMAAYGKYPNLVSTILHRARMYNKTLAYIEKWEREGKIFVIRPSITPVSKAERSYQHLMEFYQHGYDVMKAQYEAMQIYLEQ